MMELQMLQMLLKLTTRVWGVIEIKAYNPSTSRLCTLVSFVLA